MPLFDLKDLQTTQTYVNTPKDTVISGLEGMEDNLFQTYKTKTLAVIERISQIGLPGPGQQYRLITRRTFSATDILRFICQNEHIEDLRMVIYSINYFAAKMLIELIDAGKIDKCEILMSNLRNTAHREKEEIIKNDFVTHPKINLWFASSHAKIMSCRTAAGNYYTVEGSGNHSFNSRLEQYVIDNDPAIFDFTAKWMGEIKEYLRHKRELVITGDKTQ